MNDYFWHAMLIVILEFKNIFCEHLLSMNLSYTFLNSPWYEEKSKTKFAIQIMDVIVLGHENSFGEVTSRFLLGL